MKLSQFLEVNSEAEVVEFSRDELLVARLKEMGIHHGLVLTCLGRAPFKGPLLYQFAGTVLALREEEAECILVKKV